LEVAVELRDAAAARRALDSLMTAGPGGMWLLRQMSAAALHVLADTITGPPAG
jgi:hypothetical protein